MPIRVALVGTGNVGRLALTELVTNPQFELTGLCVSSPEKVGKDAGALCGVGLDADTVTGINAVGDLDTIIAAKPDCVVYCAMGDTRLAALDLCPRIRVNAIAPGSILTSALDVVAGNDELRTQLEKATPLRRLGEPADIAAAALYLASPAGAYLTGKTLEVDGGLNTPNLELPIPDL